jgi:putative phosphoribosyl transferase
VRTLVVGINGGGTAASAVAKSLAAPLEPLYVRELRSAPGRVVGALAEGGLALLDEEGCDNLPQGVLPHLMREAEHQLEQCLTRPLPDLRFRTVVLVDDGELGTLASALALAALRERGATHVIFAAPNSRAAMLRDVVDEVLTLDPLASPEGPPTSATSPRT